MSETDNDVVLWEHFKDLYELDLKKESSLRHCFHLSKHHVDPNSNQKMKVQFAAKVKFKLKFSCNVLKF